MVLDASKKGIGFHNWLSKVLCDGTESCFASNEPCSYPLLRLCIKLSRFLQPASGVALEPEVKPRYGLVSMATDLTDCFWYSTSSYNIKRSTALLAVLSARRLLQYSFSFLHYSLLPLLSRNGKLQKGKRGGLVLLLIERADTAESIANRIRIRRVSGSSRSNRIRIRRVICSQRLLLL